MIVRHLIFLLLITHSMAANGQQQHPVVKKIIVTDVEEDAGPPPPHLTSKFHTVHDWLSSICGSKKPKRNIDQFRFGLFESPGYNVLFVIGVNNYMKETSSSTRILFPAQYFKLPQTEFGNLDRGGLTDKLTRELRAFTETRTFTSSFLAKANSITTDFGGIVWTNPKPGQSGK